MTFYTASENCPETQRQVPGAWMATVEIILQPGIAACEGGACDWFSGLLSENADILDWGYVSALPPHEIEVPDPYEEGECLTHALSEEHGSEGVVWLKQFLVCHPFAGVSGVGTFQGSAAEITEMLTDRALMDYDARVLAEFLESGHVGDDVLVSNAVVIRQK